MQSDNDSEYANKEFGNYLRKQGLKRRLPAPFNPEQNGVVESKTRIPVEIARSVKKFSSVIMINQRVQNLNS